MKYSSTPNMPTQGSKIMNFKGFFNKKQHQIFILSTGKSHPRRRSQMTDFPAESGDKEEMAAAIKNIGRPQVSGGTISSQQQQQQQILTNTTSSTSRKTCHSSQRMHQVSEMMKSDLSELKSSISEMKNLSNSTFRMRSSIEDLDRGDIDGENCDLTKSEPLVTFPDPDTPPPVTGTVTLYSPNLVSSISPNGLIANGHVNSNHMISSTTTSTSTTETVKIEQKRVASKLVTDAFATEQAITNESEMQRVQTESAASAVRSMVEIEGVSADKSIALKQDHRSLTVGEISQQESQNMTATSMKLQKEEFSSEKKAISQQQQRVLATGIYNQGKHMEQSSQSNYTITSKSVISSAQLHSLANGGSIKTEEDLNSLGFEDLERLDSCSSPQDVDKAIKRYSTALQGFIKSLECNNNGVKGTMILNKMNELIQKAWGVPTYGHELGNSFCSVLRKYGGLDILIGNCVSPDKELQFASARLLEQCLTTENREHVVENGLDKVVNVACVCTKNANNEHSRVGTGILEHLFKHSEGTCSEVIRLGGLDAVLFECRKNDIETLRHCASALANLSLYGGADNQEAMITRKVPMWLFPLAFHTDDNIKYYACLAMPFWWRTRRSRRRSSSQAPSTWWSRSSRRTTRANSQSLTCRTRTD
ncbi:UNVERIFIED_CONTAM: hypothetical protein PYX00_005744 [Menopon gallinae]|uniref:Sterile alpha and TIR motif-containing protein 1 n=2 Tax=Menopon gallinae TaxID=328185 RepID=A0AAW2HSI5_9NEOP